MNVMTPTGALKARWAVLMVLAVAIALVLVGVTYTRHVQGQFECVSRYLTALQERSAILQQIAAEDRQASMDAEDNITRLITDAIKAQGDREKGQAAADRYLRTSADITRRRKELDRQRAAQPFPQTPERACS